MRAHLPHRDQRDADEPTTPREPRQPLQGPAVRLTVHLGESDQFHHRPLYAEIVHRAHHAGLAGASVFRGIEGFGAGSVIHTSRLLDLAEDLPVAVVIIDSEERARGFLPQLREMAPDALITMEHVEAVALAAPETADSVARAPEEGTR
ncbi:DUF190 domain-containing protein [Streptomyces sp. RB6PN25]|uniref:DUF190 domain-containing protein n=1 Tax=Streptomyces humicola TaxID=2953240 RepID=A0ABT1PSB2_9ACTN|nr:DUF190 domain-containing protein [Streptomyces humicola]MCQ4079460.1 DUF190 domain-containing protein [Streptomyces humicola]